jgi:hypothetical protein
MMLEKGETMRNLIWILPFVILLGATPQTADKNPGAVETSLLILLEPDAAPAREALYKDFHVLEDLGEFMVAYTLPSDDAMLLKAGLAFKRISISGKDGALCVVSLKELDASDLARTCRVLHAGEQVALVAADEGSAARLERPVPHYGLVKGIRPLQLERIKAPATFQVPSNWKPGSRAADPKIQTMVDQVNAVNIQNVVQDLEDMGERKANSGGFVAEQYLVDSFNAIGGLDVSTHHFSGSYSDNVIAELPGTVDPSVIVIVGGHYDSTSWSGAAPGADDNASGTSGVREIARILSQYEFKYTLRFIAFGAEELGLIGSDAYCDLLVSQGAAVLAMINLDMTAYRASGDTRDVDFITNYSSSSLIDYCSDMYATYVPSLGVKTGSFSGGTSDHQSFTQHGYAACFPFEDVDQYSPHIHSSNDLIGPSANDFTLARQITQGVLASLATLASPVDMAMDHTTLTDTTDASGPYAVTAEVSSLIGSNVTQVTLHYDVGAGYVAKDMVYTGAGDEWISSIPGKASAGYVKYYFESLDDLGNYERLPDGFGADHFEFFVGYVDDVYADDFEISSGWTHGGTGQDDWQNDTPAGNGGYDPSSAASGAKVWGNDLGHGNYNGNYQPNVNNWLESPSIDCTGQTGVHLRYRRWLTVEEGQYDQAKILVNGNQVFANPASGDHIDTAWELHDIDISAHADNNPNVKIKYTLTTDGGKELGGWTIDDLHVGTVSDGDLATLSPEEVYVEISLGGFIDLTLNGSATLAGRLYALLVTTSGTSPGTPVGSVVLPLNWDVITDICAANFNTPVFDNFLGYLDGNGVAVATVYVPVITDPAAIGLQLDFAWLTLNPIDFASDPAGILLVP